MTQNPDQEPTVGGPEQHGPDWEVLMGPGGPEPERTPPGAALRARWQRRSGRARAVTAAATVVVLALGGTVAYAATASGSGDGATPAAGGTASESSSPDDRRPWRGPGMGFGLGGEAAHGEATVKDRDTGDWVVRIWQWGTIENVDGDQVTVKSEDGAEWTWTVDEDTTVWHDGSSDSGADELKEGESAHLAGTRSDDDTRTAARVISGSWDDKDDDKGWGPGDRHFKFPGHREGKDPEPSKSGATT
ncbi:DUF5666 domain-containing protein [Streptomyces sp. NBC_00445]|uniref:hypothetical protein n=1 Tax=unclassified Streptomyces TaxID=2593676 RepID=UPI002E213342|nr:MULTISPECIES: hypothetical protein [unclassified Streptomyces]